jgi:hypothetical protein
MARPDELVPDPLDKGVHARVAAAVREAASEPEIIFEARSLSGS